MTSPQQALSQQAVQWVLVVDGKSLGEWEEASASESTGTTSKFRPGAMRAEEEIKALPTYGDITFTRTIRTAQLPEYEALHRRSGSAPLAATGQVVDLTGARLGSPMRRSGTLQSVSVGATSVNNTDRWMVSLTMSWLPKR